mgnify:FL=1
MSPEIKFPEGELYGCSDPECLTATEPDEAIEEYIDNQCWPKMTEAEFLAVVRHPLTVTAYKRSVVPESQVKAWAESLTETLEESWAEEYGDPDGTHRLCREADAIMREAVTKIVASSTVWSCEDVGEVELTGAQVEALMREWRPDWFEDEAPRASGEGTKP